MFSLFATLFVRLYYLQVVSGEKYQGKAAAQSVRDIVVQPQRGLIVDAMGRPLVANRMSWVVSIDRSMLEDLEAAQQRRLLQPRSGCAWRSRPRSITRRLADWNGSPYQPVPVAEDVRAEATRSGSSSSPRTTRACSWSSRASAPTRARSASTPRTSSAT